MAEYNSHRIIKHIPPIKPMGRLLYVDILNYLTNFFNLWKWDIRIASEKVKHFTSAAANAGWTLRIFIDGVIESEEALGKWRKRRLKEVSDGRKNIPQCGSTLIGDLFSAQGVEVFYSLEKDNDDTIAFHAVADGADILSGDKDFFRYKGANYRVYKSYSIISGSLKLQEQRLSERQARGASTRELEPPPAVQPFNPIFTSAIGPFTYRRGVPSPLVRLLGNPHIAARPLRRALYARLGIKGEVLEEFPVWDPVRNEPTWDIEKVVPDCKWNSLLDSPRAALLQVYLCSNWPPCKPSNVISRDFSKHVFAMETVVFEICIRANGDQNRLADTMLSLSSQLRSKPRKRKKRVFS